MEQSKAYYAIIPANVRYDKSIPMGAKLLYGEITALCNEKGFCWATNRYFAELYCVNERTVRNWICALAEQNFIYNNIQYDTDGKTVLQRCLSIKPANVADFPTYGKKFPQGKEKNFPTPTEKNFLYNNTSMNNTDDDYQEVVGGTENNDGNNIALKEFLDRYPSVQVDIYGTGQLSLIDFAELLKRFDESEYLRTNCTSLQWIVRNRSLVMSGKYKDKGFSSNQQLHKLVVDGSLYKIL